MNYQTIITPASLADNLYRPNWLIMDCRGTLVRDNKAYNSYVKSHIPNAYYYCSLGYDCNDIQNSCNYLPSEPIQMLENLEEYGFDASTQIVIYEDLNSSFTDTMWLKLRSLGFQQVAVLHGGFASWCSENLPLTLPREEPEVREELESNTVCTLG